MERDPNFVTDMPRSQVITTMAGWFDKTIKIIDLFSGLSTLDSYFVQASSALDYFYAYSKNETLLQMSPE